MQVNIQNDGPVTISLETPPSKPAPQNKVVHASITVYFWEYALPFHLGVSSSSSSSGIG